MTPQVEFLHSDQTIREAAEKMKQLNVGVVPVVAGGEAVGIVTDRDIVLRSVAQGLDPEKHKIMEAVSGPVISCKEDDDVAVAAGLMEDNQIRRVLVRDNDGKLTGIASLGDLAVNLQEGKAGEILREVSEPAEPVRA
jgi:CBS domain-containing protein